MKPNVYKTGVCLDMLIVKEFDVTFPPYICLIFVIQLYYWVTFTIGLTLKAGKYCYVSFVTRKLYMYGLKLRYLHLGTFLQLQVDTCIRKCDHVACLAFKIVFYYNTSHVYRFRYILLITYRLRYIHILSLPVRIASLFFRKKNTQLFAAVYIHKIKFDFKHNIFT